MDTKQGLTWDAFWWAGLDCWYTFAFFTISANVIKLSVLMGYFFYNKFSLTQIRTPWNILQYPFFFFPDNFVEALELLPASQKLWFKAKITLIDTILMLNQHFEHGGLILSDMAFWISCQDYLQSLGWHQINKKMSPFNLIWI